MSKTLTYFHKCFQQIHMGKDIYEIPFHQISTSLHCYMLNMEWVLILEIQQTEVPPSMNSSHASSEKLIYRI